MIGALAGLAIGCLIGYLKNIFIWKGYVNREEYTNGEQAQALSRAMISYVVNIIVLLVVFLLRNYMPWNWMVFIAAVATGLAGMNIVTSMRRK